MPTRKLRLNRAEQARYLIALRQLQAAGLDFEIPEELLENSRAVDITVAGGPASSVFDSSRGTFYAIWVRLVAERPDTLMDCRMSTDWDDHIVLRSFDEAKAGLQARSIELFASRSAQSADRKCASI